MGRSRVHLFVDNSNVKIEGGRLAHGKRLNGGRRDTQHLVRAFNYLRERGDVSLPPIL